MGASILAKNTPNARKISAQALNFGILEKKLSLGVHSPCPWPFSSEFGLIWSLTKSLFLLLSRFELQQQKMNILVVLVFGQGLM